MKKTLLLSVVASTMIMAGGDIAPVEPVVEAPVEVSGWEFGGQAVGYYQTRDSAANDLFSQESARANVGIQFRAINKDLLWGFGAGVEVNGLGTWGLQEDVVFDGMQNPRNSGWISQAYLTYGFGDTTIKAGRQELPKALSPFAFSEGWNVFKNTFDAALIVNSSLQDTTLVGAWVAKANFNAPGSDMSNFRSVNPDGAGFSSGAVDGDDQGIFMLTAQNKSIDGLTLTGTYYYANEFVGADDAHILWGDAKFALSSFNIGLQGGTVMSDGFTLGDEDTLAYGAKIGGNFGMFDATLAYSGVDNGQTGIFNVGGVKTPLYTQMILNQGAIRSDNDTIVVKAGMKALGGKFGAAFDYTTSDNAEDYTEFDLTYKTKIFSDSTTVFAGYVYTQQDGVNADDAQNLIRVWGRYNF